ncbi:MAG: reverse gyrase [Thermosipho sp. (in: Bacteria)]|nr:reverse gyrase [Thermosipho sp. (in: thermotogales)]
MGLGLEYIHSCVNCEEVNTDERNLKGLPCKKCLPEITKDYIKTLKRKGLLLNLYKYVEFYEKLDNFEKFFKDKLGFTLNSYQKIWAKRVILKRSFTLVAPTGVGKTTFGLMMSIWLSKEGKRSILVFPTVPIINQVVEKIKEIDKNVDVLFYNSNFKRVEKERFEEKFKQDNYDILVISTQFLSKRKKDFKDKGFDFVFVDDVDSVLKSSRNIDTIISLTGVSEDILKDTMEKIKKGEKPEINSVKHGILVISSASAKPKGLRPLLFRYIFNFNLGKISYLSRNITHLRVPKKDLEKLCEILRILKDGIIIYVLNEDEGKILEKSLKEKGFQIGTSWEDFEDTFEKFKRGELPILIGISSYYGKLVRGIDLPERIKYAIFWGIPKFVLKDENVLIPDFNTYIQASGRTSRLLNGNLVKGVSIVFEANEELYEKLISRLIWFSDEEFYNFSDVDLKSLVFEVEQSRKIVLKNRNENKSKLIIVESPTKAETIAKFFGISSIRQMNGLIAFETITENGLVILTSTRGHTFDLVTKKGYHGVEVEDEKFTPIYNTIKRCKKCGYQFIEDKDTCPKCDSKEIDNKLNTLKSLRELALEVEEILVASDPDVEGEKIAYDVTQYLYPVNSNISRIELHEITRNGYKKGLDEKRDLNENLVKAQIIRRIEDRWIGFELSQILQKHFKKVLSAGRVQSTVLGWIIKRESEYKKSIKTFTSFILKNGLRIEFEGEHENLKVKILEVFEEKISPPPPFNTPTILSEISRKYKYSANQIMNILQDLFENGFITYHRTDSTRISFNGQIVAEKFLKSKKLEHLFKGRNWGDEGAHEGIRPVKPVSPEELEEMIREKLVKIDKKHLTLYKEIFNRFMASQTREVKVKKMKVLFESGSVKKENEFVTEILENGWNLFLPIKVISKMEENEIVKREIYKKHTIPLFTQASLIDEMKSQGIGRPSTYAKIISILFERRYIIEDMFKRIKPTKLGILVYDYLSKNYRKFITEETTRDLELKMKLVEKGEKDFQEMLKEIYEEVKGGEYEEN